jgi:uncharacterized protein with GYD domain
MIAKRRHVKRKPVHVYISLGRFAKEGVAEIKNNPKRLEQIIRGIGAMGVKMKLYLTLGRLDFIIVSEGPTDEDALKAILTLETLKAIRVIETMKAMPPERTLEIIKTLP